MVSQRSFLSVLWIFTSIASGITQQCYGLNGSVLNSTYAPCNPTAKHSGCCATNRTNGSPDICLDNALCMTTNGEELGMVWQRGCTDKAGQDAACPKMCPNATNAFNGSKPVAAWQIQTCDYGTYCCRAAGDRRSCCGSSSAPKISTNSIGALPLQTTTAPTTPAAAAPTWASCEEERLQVAVVGSTIGGLFGATILALASALFWVYKRERRQRRLKEHYEGQFAQTNAYRKALASTAGSLRNSISMEELMPKSDGLQ